VKWKTCTLLSREFLQDPLSFLIEDYDKNILAHFFLVHSVVEYRLSDLDTDRR